MTLTNFQIKKVTRLFEFWDVDNNGYHDEEDYSKFADRLAEFRGWEEGTPEYEAAHTSLQAKWAEASQFADTNNDNRITLDEWIVFWDTIIHNDEMYQVVVNDIRSTVIDAVDIDGDGIIDLDDWRNVFKIYNYNESLAEETFKTIDRDSDGKITSDDVGVAGGEFLKSNDESALGNYIFGPLN